MSDLISCIMPTTEQRRPFLPLAIECFLKQTYANKELVVLCDHGTIEDLIPDDARVKLFVTAKFETLGEKYNKLHALARGAYIAPWADDDWQAPWSLSVRYNMLKEAGVERVGSRSFYFCECAKKDSPIYIFSRPVKRKSLWVAHGTMMYTIGFALRNQYPSKEVGSDYWFQMNEPKNPPAFLHGSTNMYVAMRHGHNTWKAEDFGNRSQKSLGDIIGPRDAERWLQAAASL